MKDIEKLIIVFYIDISNIDRSDVLMYMENARNAIDFDDTVKTIFIPIEETTRVEVLNPKCTSKNEYKKIVKRIEEALDKAKEKYNNTTKEGIIEHKHYFVANGLKVHWDFKLLPKGFEAITLFGHIFDFRKKEALRTFLETHAGEVMVNHERIHTLQAESFKLRYFTFYLIYLWYWFIGLFKYGVKNNASYYHVPFEIEAYVNEQDFAYPRTKWKKYIEK